MNDLEYLKALPVTLETHAAHLERIAKTLQDEGMATSARGLKRCAAIARERINEVIGWDHEPLLY